MSDTPVILANGLGRRFGKGETELTILEEIDLTVMAGETVAIIGQSGSGKSTLLQLLGGLDTPTSGSVAIHGRGIATLSEKARGDLRNRELGFVYQFHHLIKELSALENVMLPALIGGKPVNEAKEAASQLLVDAGLGERLRHLPGQLSGGERQRVAI
ncbi:MAG: ATP-binding cassette domain-containing protein, partial [Gammaproteobacteria bacterium]|nr:ATP-binding cassette domain-containing protein [Gammaproteobacteria bacterium]